LATVRKRTWQSRTGPRTAWIADYSDQAGKRHVKTFTYKKAADAWLVTARHQVVIGTHTAESGSITVAEAAALWIQRGELERLEQSTVAKYRNHVDRHIVPLLGSVTLARLSAPMVEQFRDDLLARASWPMARKVLGSLKAIIGDALRRGLVAQNAALAVKLDARRREREKVTAGRDMPTKAEITAILAAAAGRWRPLLITAVFTGMRASELRGLVWDDVDFARKVVRVRQRADQWGVMGSPKSAAGHREIPMAPTVETTLRSWRLACPRLKEEAEAPGRLWLVFPSGSGKPESHANIMNRGFAPIQVAAGVARPHGVKRDEEGRPVKVAKYGLHALRHFFASWAIEQGFSPKRVQALLGHSSIQMTFDVYGHLFPSVEDDHARFAAAERALAAPAKAAT
jgi:integrase